MTFLGQSQSRNRANIADINETGFGVSNWHKNFIAFFDFLSMGGVVRFRGR
jgi:hypothetical protein